MTHEFTNPLSFITNAYDKRGNYLYTLAEWRDLDKSIATAKEYVARKHGHSAKVLTSKGELVFSTLTLGQSDKPAHHATVLP